MKRLLLALLWPALLWAGETNSTVYLARNPSAVTGLSVDAAKVRALVSAGIQAYTGQPNDTAAWQSIANSNDVVGIKISTFAAPLHVTHREVVDAIAGGLVKAGVAPAAILVWSRDARRMKDGGWPPAAPTTEHPYRVLPVIQDAGWDPKGGYDVGLVGKLIWGDLDYGKEEALGTKSHFPVILNRAITKLINVPVVMDHDPCGISGCLYNLSLGTVDNARRFEQGNQRGDPAIAEINANPAIRSKLVLNIADALVVGYAGGPAFKPRYSAGFGGLYFSRDPVAVDALCRQLIDGYRKEDRLIPITPWAGHVDTAGQLGLGQSAVDQIKVIPVAP